MTLDDIIVPKSEWRLSPMTVCIAAIYNNNAIFGASDRMVTGGYGDITFEPPAPKIFSLTNSIAVLTAGNQSIQIQVYQDVSKTIGEKIISEPTKWIEVSFAAELYSKAFYKLRNKRVEERVLSNYGLTFDTFIARQKQMSEDFINMLSSKIQRCIKEIDSIETIITGIDDTGPHIFVVQDGEISCHDKLGFASIGIGGNHAISHFMFTAYSRMAPETKALLTIHQAKKKAEVSPGVGKNTDMCVIGPLKGSLNMITKPPFPTDVVKDLDGFYEKYKKRIDKMDKKTEKDIEKYMVQSIVKANQQEISPSPETTPLPAAPPSSSPNLPSKPQQETKRNKFKRKQ